MSFLNRLMGKPPSDPVEDQKSQRQTLKDQTRQWTRELQRQHRQLDRDKLSIQREQNKLKQQLRAEAKKPGHQAATRVLAKSLVQSNKHIDRLVEAQVRIDSVSRQLQSHAATINATGILGRSVTVMQSMNELVKLPEVAATARELSKEMAKAGLIDEMMDETFSSLDNDSIEEETDAEVQRVIAELTEGMLSSTGQMKARERVTAPQGTAVQAEQQTDEEAKEIERLRAELK